MRTGGRTAPLGSPPTMRAEVAVVPDIVDPVLEAYAEAHTTPPPPHLVAVAERTRATLATAGPA